jgi:hypothetical protein
MNTAAGAGHPRPDDADNPLYDDAGLDELLATAMGGMLAKLEAGFRPADGLADVRARLGAGPARTEDR